MSLVSNFITHYQVEITRVGEGYYSDDTLTWIDGVSTTFNVDLSIQPVNQRERQLLPEAVRDTQIIKMYHETALQITNDRTNKKGDKFTYNNNVYQVISSSDWNTGDYDIKYYKSFAVMIDKDGSYVR